MKVRSPLRTEVETASGKIKSYFVRCQLAPCLVHLGKERPARELLLRVILWEAEAFDEARLHL